MVNNLRRRGKFEAFQTKKSKAITLASKKESTKNIESFLDGNKQYFDFFCIFASKT
jgi:hypothetical protein